MSAATRTTSAAQPFAHTPSVEDIAEEVLRQMPPEVSG